MTTTKVAQRTSYSDLSFQREALIGQRDDLLAALRQAYPVVRIAAAKEQAQNFDGMATAALKAIDEAFAKADA